MVFPDFNYLWESEKMGLRMKRRVYLAGPEVFLPNPSRMANQKKDLCSQYNLVGVFPLDAELDISVMALKDAGYAIASANENLIRSCDLVIANITPFRGPSADVGTVFEIGFASALGLKIFAYSNTTALFSSRTKSFCQIQGDVDQQGLAIEQFEMVDNLMIDGAIKASGGAIVTTEVNEVDRYTSLEGFKKCLELITF